MSETPESTPEGEGPKKAPPPIIRYGFRAGSKDPKAALAEATSFAERKAKGWRELRGYTGCRVQEVRPLDPKEAVKGYARSTHLIILGSDEAKAAAFSKAGSEPELPSSESSSDDSSAAEEKSPPSPAAKKGRGKSGGGRK